MDKNKKFALGIVKRLRKTNFQAYFAGGCVRDMAMKKTPGDYDIATDATPKQIKRLLDKTNKLHIGCGETRIDGFINIDAFKTKATDFNCQIEALPKYIKPNTISLIYSSHTLEHFNRRDSIETLKMFHAFLEPAGVLRISVPDLLKLSDIAKRSDLDVNNIFTAVP